MDAGQPVLFETADISLDREGFLGSVLKALATTLQDTVGVEEASGFVSLVGMAIGEELRVKYEDANGGRPLDRTAVTAALIDLKRRIGGDFYLIEETEDRTVLGNRRCPFGDWVIGRPSLCMMTSNVFGRMVAESQGYGRVTLDDTIASGGTGCRIAIDLDPDGSAGTGRRYHRTAT
jgi:predicted ArsR family transcriptional regulator